MDNQSIAHTRWNYTYHIVFILKCRRRIMYGELKKDVRESLKKLCKISEAQLIEGKRVWIIYIYMHVTIPPNRVFRSLCCI